MSAPSTVRSSAFMSQENTKRSLISSSLINSPDKKERYSESSNKSNPLNGLVNGKRPNKNNDYEKASYGKPGERLSSKGSHKESIETMGNATPTNSSNLKTIIPPPIIYGADEDDDYEGHQYDLELQIALAVIFHDESSYSMLQ